MDNQTEKKKMGPVLVKDVVSVTVEILTFDPESIKSYNIHNVPVLCLASLKSMSCINALMRMRISFSVHQDFRSLMRHFVLFFPFISHQSV